MDHAGPTERRRERRRWRLAAPLLAVGLLAAACGDDTDGGNGGAGTEGGSITDTTIASSIEDAQPGGRLVVGLEAESATYLPSAGSMNSNVARALFDAIAVHGADGEIHPYLAESIEPNDDLSEWTVTLREGIVFHDGTPLDAQAIKDNFDEHISADGSTLAGRVSNVQEVRLDGPLTYTYVLDGPTASFPDVLTGPVGYPFSNVACRAAGDECGNRPVGAGPFRMVSWTRDAEMRLERHEDYWRSDENGLQLPYLDELVFRPIPDEDSRFASVRSGDIDVGQTLRQSIVRNAEDAEAAGEIQSLEALGNNGAVSVFNVLRPPFDDLRVRRALVHATNQEELIAVLGGEGLTPIQTQYFSPQSPWFSSTVEEAYPTFDPDTARELLEDYTSDPDRSDGKEVGAPVAFRYQCPPDPSLLALSQAYQAYWDAVGVEVTLEQVEQPVLITNTIGNADQDPPFIGAFEVTCFRAGADEDPYTTLAPGLGDPSVSPTNYSNHHSDNIAEQLEVLRTTADFDSRYAAVESMMLELAEEVPLMWIGGTATSLYATNEVRNLGGWTAPGGVQGNGVLNGVIFWSEVWLAQ